MTIFLAHSSKDKQFARRLDAALRKRGHDVWLDERDLKVGDYLPERLTGAIADSAFTVIVISKNTSKAKWVKFELNTAITKMIEGRSRILPALVGPIKAPPVISSLVYADFTRSFSKGLKKLTSSIEGQVIETGSHHKVYPLIKKVFGLLGSVDASVPYRFISFYWIGPLGKEGAALEIIDADDSEKLDTLWWHHFTEAFGYVASPKAFVISEKPFELPNAKFISRGVQLLRFDTHTVDTPTSQVFLVYIPRHISAKSRLARLFKAKQLLI